MVKDDLWLERVRRLWALNEDEWGQRGPVSQRKKRDENFFYSPDPRHVDGPTVPVQECVCAREFASLTGWCSLSRIQKAKTSQTFLTLNKEPQNWSVTERKGITCPHRVYLTHFIYKYFPNPNSNCSILHASKNAAPIFSSKSLELILKW